MPISNYQSDVLRLLAAQRSPDRYITGGIAINRQGPRFSDDIDIFHNSIERQQTAIEADENALSAAGYTLTWPHVDLASDPANRQASGNNRKGW